MTTVTLPTREQTLPAQTAPGPQPQPAPVQPASGTARFAFIDALRGIAAFGVACYHIYRYGPLPEIAEPVVPSFLGACFDRGWTGVQMFFVISGFVIAYTLRDALVTPGYLANYAFRRSLRLDPPYWATIAFVLLVHAVMSLHLGFVSPLDVPSAMETPVTAKLLAAHVLYLQNILGYDNLSAGFWTLCIEIQFYLLYVVGYGIAQKFPSRTKQREADAGPVPLLILFAPVAVASLFLWNLDSSNDMWIIHFFCMFFLGMTAWWALDGRVPGWVFWAYAATIAGRLAWDVRGGRNFSVDLSVALVAGIAIYLVGRAGKLATTLNFRPLQYLGRVSYSLYLIHFPVAHVVTTFGFWLTDESPSPAVAAFWLVAALFVSLGAAHLLYVFVEAPSVRFASRFKRPAATGQAA